MVAQVRGNAWEGVLRGRVFRCTCAQRAGVGCDARALRGAAPSGTATWDTQMPTRMHPGEPSPPPPGPAAGLMTHLQRLRRGASCVGGLGGVSGLARGGLSSWGVPRADRARP